MGKLREAMDRDNTLHAFIAHVRRRWFAKALLRTLGAAAAVAAVPLVAGAVTIRAFGLDGSALALTSAASLVLALVGTIAVAFASNAGQTTGALPGSSKSASPTRLERRRLTMRSSARWSVLALKLPLRSVR